MDQTQPQPAHWLARFSIIWLGEAISVFGSGLAQFALVWWLTSTTGSATVLATGALVAMLPGIVLGPLAGAFIDRANRRRILIVADAVAALAAAFLAYLFWTGAIQIWHVYVVMFVRSLAGAFQWPAMQASTSLMVPQQHLARVAGLNQMLQGALGIAAPPLGALLLELLPLHAIMGIDVLTALLAIVPLLFVTIPQPPARPVDQSISAAYALLHDVRAGFVYVWRWPGLRVLLGMATLINFLLTPAFSLIPILVTQHFGGEAFHLGWMNSSQSIGIVTGGVLLGVWGGFRRKIATSLAGLLGLSVGVLLVGIAPPQAFYVGVAGVLLAGITAPITNGPIFALLQTVVAPDMQGRVFTLTGSISGAMAPLGLAIAGPLSDLFGVQTWFLVGAAACLAMGIGGLLTPSLMLLEESQAAAQAGTGAA